MSRRRPAIDHRVTAAPAARGTNARGTNARGPLARAARLAVAAGLLASGALEATWPQAVQGTNVPPSAGSNLDLDRDTTDPITAVDPIDGSVYLAGTFRGTATFGGPCGVETSAADSFDVYVAKYNELGDCQWVIKGGGVGEETVADLELHDGDLYLTGSFDATDTEFGTTNLVLRERAATDIFIARVGDDPDEPEGEWKWAVGWGTRGFADGDDADSDADGFDYPSGLTIDEVGARVLVIGTVLGGTTGRQDGDACTEHPESVIVPVSLGGSLGEPVWPDEIGKDLAPDAGSGTSGGFHRINGPFHCHVKQDGDFARRFDASYGQAITSRDGKVFWAGRRGQVSAWEIYVAKYVSGGFGGNPQWRGIYLQGPIGEVQDIITDDDDGVYAAGRIRTSPGVLTAFAVKYTDNLLPNPDLDWQLQTTNLASGYRQLVLDGNNLFAVGTLEDGADDQAQVVKIDKDAGTPMDFQSTNGGHSAGRSIAIDADGNLYVAGLLEDTVGFGPESLTAEPARAAFLARLDTGLNWFSFFRFDVAQPIQPPGGTSSGAPTPTIDGVVDATLLFHWDGTDYYPVAASPATIRLLWPAAVTGDPDLEQIGVAVWPDDTQLHAAGADVDLGSTSHSYQELHYSDGAASTVDGGNVFRRSESGYSTLRFEEISSEDTAFEVVETVAFGDFEDPVSTPVDIGTEVVVGAHTRADNAFVAAARAPIDAFGPEGAYDPASRTGPILPVNVNGTGPDEQLAVVEYVANARGVSWPDRAHIFVPEWPADPFTIVIEDQEGSEGSGQPILDPDSFVAPRIYVQGDRAQPGFNPNDEHAILAPSNIGSSELAVFALRQQPLTPAPPASEPYVLLKYWDPIDTLDWKLAVYQVTQDVGNFNFEVFAGGPIPAPYPLALLGDCAETFARNVSGTPFFQDVRGGVHARANGEMDVTYYYPLQSDFYFDSDRDGEDTFSPGECVQFVDEAVRYLVDWPENAPTLSVGETVVEPKTNGLPDILHQAAVMVAYQGSDTGRDFDSPSAELDDPIAMVKLFDALSPRWVDVESTFPVSTLDRAPFYLEVRLEHDPVSNRLAFKGFFNNSLSGDDPLLLINVMSTREKDLLLGLSDEPDWTDAIEALYDLSRNPLELTTLPPEANGLGLGLQDADPDPLIETLEGQRLLGAQGALSAGAATTTGYVTLAFNNDASLDPGALPISLEVIKVDCVADGTPEGALYQGAVHTMPSDNVFDERLTLRHSGDFGGEPERYAFSWYHKPDPGMVPTDLPTGNGWFALESETAGAVDITLQGANERTISDGYVLVNYNPVAPPTGTGCGVSPYTGDPASTPDVPTAKLAEGWIKRVIRGLDPFRARSDEFHTAPTATYASMIEQAGEPYAGPIAFNGDPGNVNQLGLIEAYETVLRRGIDLSIGGGLNVKAANTALLLAAGRIADLTMLLGNEAWADAQDPTIGFGTQSGVYGNLAPSIFAFQNQLSDLLDEELALLRGRDGSSAAVNLHPVFNRLIWNIETGDVGEAAYSQVYDIRDRDADGFIDAADARIQYPQGHGDAWGHYTTALKGYYRLLRHPDYTWTPRAEAINVAGTAVTVDYRDERKLAAAAAARAGAGAEIAALTYREAYVEDPAGQWQGYKDPDPQQAWGLSGWARRAGHGAYLDWVTANALLPDAWQPEDRRCDASIPVDECPSDPIDPEIGQIDRGNVPELGEITQGYGEIQTALDRADAGLNPLGLARGVVPFDIDPSRVDPGPGVNQGKTHFEQIHERAVEALSGAITVFDHANQLVETLRRNQDTLADFSRNVEDRERDFRNRLIEIFGYPYADDIGGAGTYPPGYDDADLYHYMLVDSSELTGEEPGPTETLIATFAAIPDLGCYLDDPTDEDCSVEVEYEYDNSGFGLVKPSAWTGSRKAPGDAQRALSDFFQAINAFEQALAAYDVLLADIDGAVEVLEAQYDLNAAEIDALGLGTLQSLQDKIFRARTNQLALRRTGETTQGYFAAAAEALPDGADHFSSGLQGALLDAGVTLNAIFASAADAEESAELEHEQALEEANAQTDLDLATVRGEFEVVQRVEALEQLVRREPGLLLEAFNRREAIRQALGNYQQVLARGLRLIDELATLRARTAADVQQYRYQDLAFRVARNDALQKYRAQFDLAARYVYLAATAYDYETNLLGTAGGAGRDFLTDIVGHRSLGEVIDGEPQAGSRGLADPLARMGLNFEVLKGQLGFNNPQTETTRFSLRSELSRIDGTAASDNAWRDELERWRVDNLWDLPEFRRFARPFAPRPIGPCTAEERDGCEPGLVIGLEANGGQPMSTQVVAGLNYFGHELGAGDSAYDATNFATRIRSVGLWLTDYETAGLSATPTAYVIPVGEDVLRPPTAGDFTTRRWAVIDQVLPVPFPVGVSSLDDPLFIPINDSLSGVSGQLGDVRRFSSFRAFPDNGGFEPSQTTTNSRLIGRSVWNTRWLIIIPGRTLLNDPDDGLDQFVEGVTDVKLFFQTYAYSGN